jgi:flagellar basal-body rod modification protein FlgD
VNLNSIVQQLQAERQQQASGVSAKVATAKVASSSGSAGDSGDATITADDFLTLLVTELQNQDPTSDSDPNAYVNQLVDVNSLQQLISINSGIGSLDSSVGATGTQGSTSGSAVTGTDESSTPSARVSQAQVNTAQASYAAFGSAPDGLTGQLSIAQQLDASNPVLNSLNANVNPAVPPEWRTTQEVLS